MNYKQIGIPLLIFSSIFFIGIRSVFAQANILHDEINQARNQRNFSEIQKRLQDKRPHIEISQEEKKELEELQRKFFLNKSKDKEKLGIKTKFLEDNSRLDDRKIKKNKPLDSGKTIPMKKKPIDTIDKNNKPRESFLTRVGGFFGNLFR